MKREFEFIKRLTEPSDAPRRKGQPPQTYLEVTHLGWLLLSNSDATEPFSNENSHLLKQCIINYYYALVPLVKS